MKKGRSDYLAASLMTLCVGLLFLFLNRGLNTYLAVHFSLMLLFESGLLLLLGLMPIYQSAVNRRMERLEQERPEEEDEDDDDRDDWKPVTGAAVAIFLTAVLITAFAIAFFITGARRVDAPAASSPVHIVVCVVIFILYACVQKWWSMKEGGEGLCRLMLLNKGAILVLFADLLLSYTGAVNITRFADLALAALWVYLGACAVIGLFIKRFRRRDSENFSLFLPIPFYRGEKKEGGLLDWLERNTGISMRSLWSLKFLKVSLPTCLLGGILLLWLSTCVVQVDASQQGALYRFGRLSQEDILQPGLHFKLPVPFEVAKVEDVTHARTMVVGYEGDGDTKNNLWTLPHKGEEHKLLLGSGRELVAINLKVNYRISDLHAYLTNYTSPEDVLNAKGYEIVMHATVNTDVDTIMSVDRSALSRDILRQLQDFASHTDLGIEVMDVALASIHPPVEISDIYQNVVSAGIQKKAAVLGAEGSAMAAREQAEADRQVAVNQAGIKKDERVSAANAEVTEYNAAVEAYRMDHEAYKMDKYLNAVQNSLSGVKKYILGPGVDESRLYSGFGSLLQGKTDTFGGLNESETEPEPEAGAKPEATGKEAQG